MDPIILDFKRAQAQGSGPLLATTITPQSPVHDPNRLRSFYHNFNSHSIASELRYALTRDQVPVPLAKDEIQSWVCIYTAFWKTAGELLKIQDGSTRADWKKVFDYWKELTNELIRGYSSHDFPAWTLSCIYVVGKYLRIFAMNADSQDRKRGTIALGTGFQEDIATTGSTPVLEEAARVLNRVFTLCISDRAPIEESRKWGLYCVTNMLFKTYFKLNQVGLCKNLIRALQVAEMPPMESFPKSHIVTFKYYLGVILFLEEDYLRAEENLTSAWMMCHKNAHRNKELILTYLIPCHLLTTHTLASSELLAPYPRLAALFKPLGECIRRGDLAGFDAALAVGEDEFVKRRIYLTLERGRDIALRNLFRRVFVAGGFESPKDGGQPIRRTRVPVAEFVAALRVGRRTESNAAIDTDEVECLLANLIYKSLMKGYIARERGMIVLSKNNQAFPGTGV